MNEAGFLGQIYAFIFANYLVIIAAVIAVLGIIFLVVEIRRQATKKKEDSEPSFKETHYGPGISFGVPEKTAAKKPTGKDEDPNTVTLDETAGKVAVFSYVDYKGDIPAFPRLPLPDGNDYWIFIKRKTAPEPIPLILPVNVAHTPEILSDADNDVDTPALLALLQEGSSIWEKAIIGELGLLVVGLIIYSLCVM